MKLKLTLAPRAGEMKDVVVTTDATATVGDLALALERAERAANDDRDVTLVVSRSGGTHDTVLDAESAIAQAPIGSGDFIRTMWKATGTPAAGVASSVRAVLTVVAGPDIGKRFELSDGTHYIGRETGMHVQLNDDFVSKRHAKVTIGDSIELVDLNSANGILLDGGLVSRLIVEPHHHVMLGDSVIQIEPTGARSAPSTTANASGGSIPFVRSPRVEARFAGTEFPRPEVPGVTEKPPFPWIIIAVPLLMAIVVLSINLVSGRGSALFSLIFVAMTPLMIVGNYMMNSRTRQRRHDASVELFGRQLAALDTDMVRELGIEHHVRNIEAPTLAEVAQHASARANLLWTRRPEHWSFLQIRLGTGVLQSRSRVADRGAVTQAMPEYEAQLDAVIHRNRMVADVPVVETLPLCGAMGVAGGPTDVAAATRGYLLQLAGLHSPAELALTAMVGPRWAADLEWMKWLPHTSSPQSPIVGHHLADNDTSGGQLLAALEEVIEQRSKGVDIPARLKALAADDGALAAGAKVGEKDASPVEPPMPAIVVVLSEDAPVDLSRAIQIAERGPQVGVYVMWMATATSSVPAACRTIVDLGRGGLGSASVGFVRLGITVDSNVEGLPRDSAEQLARGLAPVLDVGAVAPDVSDLPSTIGLLELLGDDLAESDSAVIDRWRENGSLRALSSPQHRSVRRPPTLRALVGQAGADAMHIDLRAHGPHALVGGTTGSGKSEFLQSWILALAAEYSPERLTFLFVDYKGGAAFEGCVPLPHCVGLVTDLTPHLVKRALDSLRAELRHRERLFAAKKAKDLIDLEVRGDPDTPPALVIVIDEFAALHGEVPEFVDGVIDIAQRGRSLGIHLIMATQRPAGVITNNLRANTNLRIALRVADEADSHDVVGSAVAAGFDPGMPGRAVAKIGPGRLSLFQSAYAGGWTKAQQNVSKVDIADLRFGPDRGWDQGDSDLPESQGDLGPNDLARVVQTISKAARSARVATPRPPWLPELGVRYDLTQLHQRTDAELVIGVADLPESQEQRATYFKPDEDGNLAVFGTGGSGKSVLLRTLAAAAGITPRGGPVEVYGLDFGSGGLAMLEEFPHVGSVIPGDDSERVIRVLRQVKETLDERAVRYAKVNAGSIVEYRTQTGEADEPRILLLLDGYPAFRNEFEGSAARSQWYGVFQQILNEGRRLGIHVVLSADRLASIPGSVASAVPRRVVLRLADDAMYMLLGVEAGVITPSSPPGRAVVDGLETQIAVIGGSSVVAEQAAATTGLAAAIERTGRLPVQAIRSLPELVRLADLPAAIDGQPVLGISEDALEPIGFAPSGVLLVGGGPGTGRSTALEALSASVSRWNPDLEMFYFGGRRSGLGSSLDWHDAASTIQAAADLANQLRERAETDEPLAIVIESLGEFLNTPADLPLVELVKAVRRNGHLAIAEAEASVWTSSWALFNEFKAGRRGILLAPDQAEGEAIMRTQFPRISRAEFPPGRGMYVDGGRVVRIQMPMR